jgi:hypothetical protein
MTQKKKTQIDSLRTLQRNMPRVLKEGNANPALALAAAANPLLALEHLGYEIAPEARQEIELHARFGPDKADEVVALEKSIYKAAGSEFDLADGDAVQETVYALLQPAKKGQAKEQKTQKQRVTQALEALRVSPTRIRIGKTAVDPLAEFTDLHPILPLLVEHRQLERQHPRFASRDVFDSILSGERKTAVTSLKFRLQDRERRKEQAAKK